MKRILLSLLALLALTVGLAACDPSPPPNQSGWVSRYERSDGLPMTHYCGTLYFEIRDGGDPNFRTAAVEAVWAIKQAQQHKEWIEVAPGTITTGNGIIIQNGDYPGNPLPPGMPVEATEYTDVRIGMGLGNISRATVYIRGDRFYNIPDGDLFRLRAVRHGMGHAIGMHDTRGVDSIMDYVGQRWDNTLVDVSAHRYLMHPDNCFYWE